MVCQSVSLSPSFSITCVTLQTLGHLPCVVFSVCFLWSGPDAAVGAADPAHFCSFPWDSPTLPNWLRRASSAHISWRGNWCGP